MKNILRIILFFCNYSGGVDLLILGLKIGFSFEIYA